MKNVKEKLYTERSYIARGLFSEVYKAQNNNPSLNSDTLKVVALKITIPDDERPPHDSLKEARILERINLDRKQLKQYELKKTTEISSQNGLKHIIELLDSFKSEVDGFEDSLVLVFPYLPITLDQIISHYRKPIVKLFTDEISDHSNFEKEEDEELIPKWRNKLPTEISLSVIKQLALALTYLHENGIIHRDIKPQNILFQRIPSIDDDPINVHLYLADFGISWISPDNESKEPIDKKITDVGSGTYRSPQLLFGRQTYTESVDMWAVGCIIGLLFSPNTIPLFLNKYSKESDIALIATIFETLGVPTIETWPVSTT